MKKVTFEELKKMVGEYGHFTVFVHKDAHMLSCFFAEVNEKSMSISFESAPEITIYTLAEMPEEMASLINNCVLYCKPHKYVEDEEYEQMKKDLAKRKGTVAYAKGPFATTYMLLSLGDSIVYKLPHSLFQNQE